MCYDDGYTPYSAWDIIDFTLVQRLFFNLLRQDGKRIFDFQMTIIPFHVYGLIIRQLKMDIFMCAISPELHSLYG